MQKRHFPSVKQVPFVKGINKLIDPHRLTSDNTSEVRLILAVIITYIMAQIYGYVVIYIYHIVIPCRFLSFDYLI
jgi:hypothetical protein